MVRTATQLILFLFIVFSFIVNKDNKLVFLSNDNTLYDVLDFISKNKISLTKLEKLEPTLESLFMEVAR